MRFVFVACAALVACLCLSVSAAEHLPALGDLIKQVRTEREAGSTIDRRREEEFLRRHEEQRRLLDKARRDFRELTAESERLERQFRANETKLAELEALYRQRAGDFEDLSGTFRRTAADLEARLNRSVVAVGMDGWRKPLTEMRSQKSLPTSEQFDTLLLLFLELMAMQAANVSFEGEVVSPAGNTERRRVVRVGAFTIIVDGDFLSYLPGEGTAEGRLFQLARSPASRYVDAAESFAHAESGVTAAPVDPSRGVVLSLLAHSPTLAERIKQGGVVGYFILLIGGAGLLLGGERLWVLGRMRRKVNRQSMDVGNLGDNPLGRVFATCNAECVAGDIEHEVLEMKLDDAIMKEIPSLERRLGAMKVFAAVAPLLGLLGTVTGMIETFQAVTLFGTGDPKLMAGGISQALVTTALGLSVAVPILLLHTLAAARSREVREVLEVQSAGLLVQYAEKRGRVK